jgi:hypothetical protein
MVAPGLYGQLRLDQSRILYPPSAPVPLARLTEVSVTELDFQRGPE